MARKRMVTERMAERAGTRWLRARRYHWRTAEQFEKAFDLLEDSDTEPDYYSGVIRAWKRYIKWIDRLREKAVEMVELLEKQRKELGR